MNAVDYRMRGPQGIGCPQKEEQAHNMMCTQLAFVVTLHMTRSKGQYSKIRMYKNSCKV